MVAADSATESVDDVKKIVEVVSTATVSSTTASVPSDTKNPRQYKIPDPKSSSIVCALVVISAVVFVCPG